MDLGIGTYTYTWAIGVPGSPPIKPLDLMGLLDKATELDVQLIQIADNLPLHEVNHADLEALVRSCEEKEVTIEVGARGLTAEHLQTYINIARVCKSTMLRFVIDSKGYEPHPDEIVDIILGQLSSLQAHNIQLAVENHDRLMAKTFARIIERVASPSVGICLDSVNSLGCGEGFEHVLEILAPYTINLHIKDYSIARHSHMMGFNVEGTPAGVGMLPIRSLVEKLQHLGRCQSAILELWTPPEDHLEKTILKEDQWAHESISYLKPLLA
ncbi:MAG: TIM barrel protein [Cyclobacteriaceae bacterium]|nr:TIM barrel protein [Cyclobacteriaceae bacterium HetDA_MAG_MS6]